jgi:hypothetical protein
LPFIAHPFKWGMPYGTGRAPLAVALVAACSLACSSQSPQALRSAAAFDLAVPVAALASNGPAAPKLGGSGEPEAVSIAWAFRAGAPLAAAPGIGADGSVAVGSVDGYLHVLRPDGSFRWGYTLRGPLVGRPVVASNGAIFAAADPNGLYALDADGTLLWVSSVIGGVSSPPVVDHQRRVWVTTGQGTLLGFSDRGGIVGFARLGPAPTIGPTLLDDGGVAIASVSGELRIAGRAGSNPRVTASSPIFGLQAGKNALFVLAAEGLAQFDPAAVEERWSRVDVARVACAEPLVVVEHAGLRWLSAQGEPQAEVRVTIGAQRPVACLSDGSLLVIDETGALLRAARSGIQARAKLPPGRLVSLDPAPGGMVIAGYRDGRVLALRVPG